MFAMLPHTGTSLPSVFQNAPDRLKLYSLRDQSPPCHTPWPQAAPIWETRATDPIQKPTEELVRGPLGCGVRLCGQMIVPGGRNWNRDALEVP